MQPLLVWDDNANIQSKILSTNERNWKNDGYASGNPKIYSAFYNELNNKMDATYFHDLSSSFNNIKRELFIDSGHINRIGNLTISRKIAEIINKNTL